jgi:hypothetical protein
LCVELGWAPGWEQQCSAELLDTIVAYLIDRNKRQQAERKKAEQAANRQGASRRR